MKTSTLAIVVVVVIIIIAAGGYFAYTSYYNTTTSTPSTTTPPSTTSTAPVITTSSSTTSTTSAPALRFNIGVMEATTGSISGFSNETIAMATVAVNQLNAQGGILGHPVKLFVANEIPSPTAAAQTLVLQDNVSAIVGVSYTGDAIAIMPFLSQHHVLGLFTTATGNTLLNNVSTDYANYKYFFRFTLQDSTYATYLQQFFNNVTKPTSVYFVAEDLSFAHETFSAINQTLTSMGINVMGATFVPLTQTDFTTLAAQIGSEHPSMVIDAQTGIGVATFLEQLKANPSAAGIQFLDIGNGALSDPYVMGSVASSHPGVLNGVIFQQFPGTNSTPYNSLGASLILAYQNATHQTYYSFPSNSFTAIHVLAQSMVNANTVSNVSAIITAMEHISYEGSAGLVTFDTNHNWIVPTLWYTQFQNGHLQVIWPPSFATSTYQPPS
ncbi:MAG: ABC transporter substrate-binding protein [Thaumarchaeota archaeon]|nr:ABC transporter substrate-binding protein [Nitrososphaerota archaeon]